MLLANTLQIRKLSLRNFRLRAGLCERDLRGVEVTPRNGALVEEFPATFIDLLLGVKGGFRSRSIEFCFLNFLRKTCRGCGRVPSLRLFKFTFALLRCSGEV